MFTHKKIFAALLFAPLFIGCTVEDGDDDTAGDTNGETTAVSQTDTATDTDTTPTASATESESTTDDPTATATTTDTTDTDPDTTAGTTGEPGGMFCQQSCVEDVDCCPEGTEDVCPGEYPYNVTCTDGLCEYAGCTSDEDCALIEGTSCLEVNGFPTCAPTCKTDDDCLTDFGETCSGMADSGEMVCQFEPVPCVDDASCGGFGTCNEETGACECADATECPKGFECVGG